MRRLVSLILGVSCSSSTLACSCGVDFSLESSFKDAEAVYVAEVTDTKLIKLRDDEIHQSTDAIEAKFNILDVLKGDANSFKVVRDLAPGIGNCSIGLVSGMEYIFFLKKGDEPRFENYVGMCSGSRLVNTDSSNFKEDVAKLRKLGGQ